MAESELGVLSSQCLGRRLLDKETLVKQVAAWQADRNKNHQGQLALHNRRRPHQAEVPLPVV